MIIDGVDLATIGLVVGSRGESRSTPRFRRNHVSVPGANRTRFTGTSGPEPKSITLRGVVDADSLSQLRTRMDDLRWRLRKQGTHTLQWSDDSTREWEIRVEQLVFRGFTPDWVQTKVPVEILLIAEDPRARNPSLQTITTSGTPPLILTPTIGTAPMPVVITIVGNDAANLVDPVIEYRDSANTVLKVFTYTGTLTGSDTLTIDTDTHKTELNGANTIENWDAPPFFEIDPDDGDFLAPSEPDIRLTATSGDADNFQVEFRERYW